MHDHDALTFAYPEALEDEIAPRLLREITEHIPLQHGRTLSIPYDIKVGWNKGDYNAKTNPDGLRDYLPGDQGRKRQPKVKLMDRVIYR